jgi:hypothetical protein
VLELSLYALMLAFVSSIVPTTLWWKHHKTARERWQPRQIGTQVVAGGQYREGVVPTFGRAGPPRDVLIAALGCWGLGQMFLPGLALGLFGLLMVVGVVSIPGLILAWRLFFLGKRLLMGERDAADKARELATFATVLNVLVLFVTGAITAYQLGNHSFYDSLSELLLALPVALYATVSLVHAWFLRRAAAAIDSEYARSSSATDLRVDASDVAAAFEAPPALAEAPVSEVSQEASRDR